MLSEKELQEIKNRFDIIGNDSKLNYAVELAYRVASTDLTVLVTGESGVGKETIPKIIHHYSLRRSAKYFAVNCGAIPEGTVDSELFGHVKGAFTGAADKRKGYFEEADGGTLFLDEIAELPMASQAKLLRVLQSGEYIPVGASEPKKCNVRVIAATNVNLEHSISKGRFREDLYYRLNAVPIFMPALRDRGKDVELLFRKFLYDFAERYRTSRIRLAPEALELLASYRWPGNIRQLKNIAERLAVMESRRDSSSFVEISAQVLSTYIPQDSENMLPVRCADDKGEFSQQDKEMIFRAIYQLKTEVEKLKEVVYDSERKPLVRAIAEPSSSVSVRPAEVEPRSHEVIYADGSSIPVQQDTHWVSASSGEDSHPQSLAERYKDMIIDALRRNGGRKAPAAKELGISERTLYRKIKEMGIGDSSD